MVRRQLTLFAVLFAIVFSVLFAVYWLLLRPGMSVLYEDIREADAAEIVSTLDQQGIAYRLEDEGHRILVSEDEVGRARVLVAGSGIAMGGVVGFELFNETDMGLTEFAQKVNYQRALQGELARTIMMMDGVRFARVHLSLPERTLFQANQSGPKAAVTIQAERGRPLATARVEGIQQLISSAVPSLAQNDVAILDSSGQLLSVRDPMDRGMMSELDERGALEEYYRTRIAGVAESLLPGVKMRVRVRAFDKSAASLPAEDKRDTVGDQRNFRLQVYVRTQSGLPSEDRAMLRMAIADAAGMQESRGDVLAFETGPLVAFSEPGLAAPKTSSPLSTIPTPIPAAGAQALSWPQWSNLLWSSWLWLPLAVVAMFLVVLTRRRKGLSSQEQKQFADLLRQGLDEGGNNAR